jgi:tRNA A-37 threonylcarbamoyl transferase component Bud32
VPEKTDDFEPFAGNGLHGEIARAHLTEDVVSEVQRLIDPSAAVETVYWGRNYLFATEHRGAAGIVPVVVKQFRNQGWRRRLERTLRGSKAERGWRAAKELVRSGILTPEPIALVESDRADGPSFFLARKLENAAEVRHFFRRLNSEPEPGPFPVVEPAVLLERLGGLARSLHEAGIVYRDFSMGNVLAVERGEELDLYVIDFNRARIHQRPGAWRRTRDICRLPVLRREHRASFLKGYWGAVPPRRSFKWWFYGLSVNAYIAKHAVKKRLKGLRFWGEHAARGGHHDHIPPAREGAGKRDLSVWDHLSDQPHQHAGRWAKRWIRFADSPHHLSELAAVAASGPKIWSRYRELEQALHSQPVSFGGIGICARPYPEDPQAHLEALDDLGVRRVLIRLHPWETDHDDEEALARALHERGYDLVFALPQVRELVADLGRWRAAVAELGERFSPYGRAFQIGQAVNRSKWGLWTRTEYVRLYRTAAEVLRSIDGVELIGPAVIDFELQVTAALANRRTPGLDFDVLGSLLYVDRRGAPENRQLNFDTVDKVLLLKAIAETGRNSTGRSWITEVNWPLWEGPHSPAGKTVSVSEEEQADYLVRFYLLALGSGVVERIYWWRLVARGYGLIAPEPDGALRRRPAWHAMRTLAAELEGTVFHGPSPTPEGVWIYRFERSDNTVVVAWSLESGRTAELPGPAARATSRDGAELPVPSGTSVEVNPSPVYYLLG